MRLIAGGINGNYLRYITDNFGDATEEVLAAVAYATDDRLLFEWCWDRHIPLKFYGRLDEGVAVSVPILERFLRRASPIFECRLVQHHHAKVIWWRGVGVYIGSANLTDSAWNRNIEAGCYFSDDEITSEMDNDLRSLFKKLDEHSTPLTQEVLDEMRRRDRELRLAERDAKTFWASPSFKTWAGLVQTQRESADSERRREFLEEWHSTLQQLRDIGARVSRPENRPAWIAADAPPGAQADQFLHAHYYQRTFEGRKANYAAHFERNRLRKEEALAEAIDWWRRLPAAPENEAHMLNVTTPFLRAALSEQNLRVMDWENFHSACSNIHAVREYARRVKNSAVGLVNNGTQYTIDTKVEALSRRIWNNRTAGGHHVKDVITHVLYGGSGEGLPGRLWQVVTDPKWKVDGLGISSLGELVGWALPDRFPPRNGRTSKALKSLGYDVAVHV